MREICKILGNKSAVCDIKDRTKRSRAFYVAAKPHLKAYNSSTMPKEMEIFLTYAFKNFMGMTVEDAGVLLSDRFYEEDYPDDDDDSFNSLSVKENKINGKIDSRVFDTVANIFQIKGLLPMIFDHVPRFRKDGISFKNIQYMRQEEYINPDDTKAIYRILENFLFDANANLHIIKPTAAEEELADAKGERELAKLWASAPTSNDKFGFGVIIQQIYTGFEESYINKFSRTLEEFTESIQPLFKKSLDNCGGYEYSASFGLQKDILHGAHINITVPHFMDNKTLPETLLEKNMRVFSEKIGKQKNLDQEFLYKMVRETFDAVRGALSTIKHCPDGAYNLAVYYMEDYEKWFLSRTILDIIERGLAREAQSFSIMEKIYKYEQMRAIAAIAKKVQKEQS